MKFRGLDDRCSIYFAVWGWNTGGYIDNWNSFVWLQSASLHLTASHWNRWCILLPMHCDQGRPFLSELRRRQISSKTLWLMGGESFPRCSMYGMFTYIYHRRKPNVGTVNIPYTGAYGYLSLILPSHMAMAQHVGAYNVRTAWILRKEDPNVARSVLGTLEVSKMAFWYPWSVWCRSLNST